mmetsp:Transcript_23025/g.25220  ORF Transcript_23025/g.25220 Transcript_23025/m.25220 type:complete len:81 (+) Transcript_23025:373-615(+)
MNTLSHHFICLFPSPPISFDASLDRLSHWSRISLLFLRCHFSFILTLPLLFLCASMLSVIILTTGLDSLQRLLHSFTLDV